MFGSKYRPSEQSEHNLSVLYDFCYASVWNPRSLVVKYILMNISVLFVHFYFTLLKIISDNMFMNTSECQRVWVFLRRGNVRVCVCVRDHTRQRGTTWSEKMLEAVTCWAKIHHHGQTPPWYTHLHIHTLYIKVYGNTWHKWQYNVGADNYNCMVLRPGSRRQKKLKCGSQGSKTSSRCQVTFQTLWPSVYRWSK